jgi:predicted deacylase
MSLPPIGIALLALLALPAPTPRAGGHDPLVHVKLAHPGAAGLADELGSRGFDVVEGSVGPDALELVVTAAERARLELEGHALELLAVGRPFRDIQAEARADAGAEAFPPSGYKDLAQVVAEMSAQAANFPAICRLVDLTLEYGLPSTEEGRHLFAVKISDNVAVDEDEPNFLMVGAHHCRELVTPVVALELIEHLVTGYGSDPTVTGLVDGQEIWVAPIWNPDGYEYVFSTDNLWRKNRRPLPGGIGVDLNRNYPFGWSMPCAGSAFVGSLTYKGPSPASEVETQTMIAFANARRFSRVIDFHSFGEEVLFGYLCSPAHPFTGWWEQRAIAIADDCGYAGSARLPTAEGEHYQWQLARGALAFLVECEIEFQPTYANAEAEAAQVLPGILGLLALPAPLSGHVTDTCTGAPLASSLTVAGAAFPNGETITSGADAGRYDLFLPPLSADVKFDRPGFRQATIALAAMPGVAQTAEVDLTAVFDAAAPATVAVGTSAPVAIVSVSDAGNFYGGLMSVSGTSPGLPLNACTMPVVLDATTFLPLKAPGVFANFVGTLDGSGFASATFNLPNDADLAGIGIDFAFFTVDATTFVPQHTSSAAHVTTTL